ncbi:GABA transporter 1 [Vitis vinifera]|uniref:GABA transporter 1 n=1 Tax=Vitis vinifera TaxID=29760 RepID=A0A438GBP1_VITVI|nr:GABA transporter 1 [Vitis vinifera]
MEAGLSHSMEDGTNPPKPLDAGALFVLKSKGSWWHCAYHLTTSIVSPAILSLPFALSLLGWVGGVFFLTMTALVTFYSYNLLSVVLEHHAQLGQRQLRPGWGRYLVGPIQIGLCYGTVIAGVLIGGQSLKFIYLLSRPNGTMQLYQFVIISGVLMLVLVQIPSFHSLRHINLVSLVLCLSFCASATAGSIYIGHSKTAPVKSYSVHGSVEHRLFGALNAISIIATTYGNGVIPEIQVSIVCTCRRAELTDKYGSSSSWQATIAPPVKGKMFKGLCVCYAVVLTTFFSVAISGWVLLMTNVFTLLQVSAVSLVYLQPTNEVLEQKFADPKIDQFAVRNVMPRLVSGHFQWS